MEPSYFYRCLAVLGLHVLVSVGQIAVIADADGTPLGFVILFAVALPLAALHTEYERNWWRL